MKGKVVAKRAITYGLAGILAAGSVVSSGCRAAHVQETPRDRAHYAVYEKYRTGNYGKSESDLILSARTGLEGYVEAAPTQTKFESLRNFAALASRVEANNARAKNALAGVDAAVISLYDKLNKRVSYEVGQVGYDTYFKCAKELDNLTDDLLKDKSLNYASLVALKNSARASGDKVMAKNVESMVNEFVANVNNLKVRVAFTNAFNVSEFVYNSDSLKSLQLEDRLEGLSTGLSHEDLAPQVLQKDNLGQLLNAAVKHSMTHWKRGSSIDPDEITRVHRFGVANVIWRGYSDGNLSGKEMAAGGYALDKTLMASALETPQDGRGKRFAKHVGGFLIPFFPLYKACEAGSHLHHEDTAAGWVEEMNGVNKKGKNVGEQRPNVMKLTMDEVNKLRYGATNGDWVVGNKKFIWGDTIWYSVEAAGQLVAIWGGIESLSGSSSSGGSSPGSNGNGGNGVPGPHNH